MILPIAKLPAKILRTPTKPVHFPLKKDDLRLVRDMLSTVKKADGIGLAGPQVSRNLNMALIYLEEAGLPPFMVYNPTITYRSREQISVEEGCLSLPGVFGEVIRPKKITVEFQNLEGSTQTITDDGWLARVLQHEIDHLNCILIIDKFKKITRGKELIPKFLKK